MITNIKYHVINIDSGVVHGMVHPRNSLCGLDFYFDNKNIKIEKTIKKITCGNCLNLIKQKFNNWSKSIDEEVEELDSIINYHFELEKIENSSLT